MPYAHTAPVKRDVRTIQTPMYLERDGVLLQFSHYQKYYVYSTLEHNGITYGFGSYKGHEIIDSMVEIETGVRAVKESDLVKKDGLMEDRLYEKFLEYMEMCKKGTLSFWLDNYQKINTTGIELWKNALLIN